MDAKELLQKYVVVEGHRDVYEQLYRTSVGEQAPLRDAIAPRLIRDGINVCVYAISGDSYSHSQNTGRYLETANPFAFWAQAAQLSWRPWLDVARALMWSVAPALPPKADMRNKRVAGGDDVQS